MTRISVTVPPPPSADYDVVVEPGALSRIADLVVEAMPAHHYAVIADGNVAESYGRAVVGALEAGGRRASLHTFEAGEGNKTVATWARLIDALLEAGVGRDGAVVGVGGGVAGDLAGFVAATYLRGVPVVQVPTSLLAMVDASVGGKTGVDTGRGKNLIGAFHYPRRVVADPRTLSTLPDLELGCGLAEAVKHGAIADAEYLDRIERGAKALLARDPEALTALVRRSVEIKAAVVEADPLESGVRAMLNFGHTVGHAIETVAGYTVPHGHAVSIGMVVEARVGEEAGLTAPGTADTIRRVLERLELPTTPPGGLDPIRLEAAMARDKKARADRIRFTLPARIGAVVRTPDGGWTHALGSGVIASILVASGG